MTKRTEKTSEDLDTLLQFKCSYLASHLWLVGWLAGWLVGWLAGWLVGWLAGWQGNLQIPNPPKNLIAVTFSWYWSVGLTNHSLPEVK